MGDFKLMILILLLVFSYFVLYIGGRKYLENFKSSDYDNKNAALTEDDYNTNRNTAIGPPEKAYAMSPIDDLDDYEVANIYQNKGSKEASKKQISEAMARYPMDWSVQGPDSQHFQDNQAEFEKKTGKTNSINLNMYKDIDGDMIPANTDAMEEEERKILQTYKPQSSSG